MRCDRISPRVIAIVIGLMAIVAFAGCQVDTCIRHSDCLSGEVCGADNVCALPPDAASDAGVLDAGVPDSDMLDARRALPPLRAPDRDAPHDGGVMPDTGTKFDGAVAGAEPQP